PAVPHRGSPSGLLPLSLPSTAMGEPYDSHQGPAWSRQDNHVAPAPEIRTAQRHKKPLPDRRPPMAIYPHPTGDSKDLGAERRNGTLYRRGAQIPKLVT